MTTEFWTTTRETETHTTYTRLTIVGKFHAHVNKATGKVEMVPPSGYAATFDSLAEAETDITNRGF